MAKQIKRGEVKQTGPLDRSGSKSNTDKTTLEQNNRNKEFKNLKNINNHPISKNWQDLLKEHEQTSANSNDKVSRIAKRILLLYEIMDLP